MEGMPCSSCGSGRWYCENTSFFKIIYNFNVTSVEELVLELRNDSVFFEIEVRMARKNNRGKLT